MPRAAKLIRGDGLSVLDVQVRDFSGSGCCVGTPSARLLPAHFSLRIDGVEGEWRCEVRWCSGSEAGVRFLTG